MTTTVVIPETLWNLIGHTDPAGRESAGVGIAQLTRGHSAHNRLLLRSIVIPGADEYLGRSDSHAVLSPAFSARAVSAAKQQNRSVVFFHTHPFSGRATFSDQDDAGELLLGEFLNRRLPETTHAALVLGQSGHSARILGKATACPVERVGARIHRWLPNDDGRDVLVDESVYDRQIAVFGRRAQESLAELRVAVVGLGGTGSLVAQQLAHLGVGNFLLIDPDTVEPSNLNRVVGAEPNDAASSTKVSVAARMIHRIRPQATVDPVVGSILLQKHARRLSQVDVVFGCTDSHGSRYVLNQIAYQYLIPVFDVGVAISTSPNGVSHVFGRCQMLAPGLPCLTCNRTLDPEQVRRDLLSDFERQRDPYIIGGAPPQPAVISLNGVVSSLIVTMFLSAVVGMPVVPRHQLYDAIRGVVRPIESQAVGNCVTCSTDGAFAQGDAWPIPGRSE